LVRSGVVLRGGVGRGRAGLGPVRYGKVWFLWREIFMRCGGARSGKVWLGGVGCGPVRWGWAGYGRVGFGEVRYGLVSLARNFMECGLVRQG